MSYCLNPSCTSPENAIDADLCQGCGHPLLLNGRYRVLQGLGQGGFGATYLARDEQLPGQPNCVIKQLRPSTNAPHVLQMARDLFEREAQTLGRVGSHPQVPRLLDYFEHQSEFFLVQEYISGATLQQEVKKNGPFSEAGVKQFLSEILPVLEYLHGCNVIHRDIKPANLIRRSHDKKLVLIDFGAVKNNVASIVETASEQTAFTAYAIGTPGFAPPEQMAMRPVPASDLYALGVTCIYLLAGKSPKDLAYDPSTGELMWRKYVNISDHFADVLYKMLEVSVRHRYQSVPEVLEALDMEPYLDSLAGSMNSVQGKATAGKPEAAEPSMTPMQRAAMSIRSRQNRPEPVSGNVMTHRESVAVRPRLEISKDEPTTSGHTIGRTGDRTGDRSIGRSSADLMAPRRMNADELLTAYGQGRRDFTAHDLENLRLKRSELTGAMFHSANLRQTNLHGSNLAGADFGRANLCQTNLRDANLSKAYLSNADLQDADLRGADLRGAYLLNANLRGTNLCGANLTGAKLAPEQLAVARTNWMTIKPNGRR